MQFSIVRAWKDLGDRDRRHSHDWTRGYWRTHFPGAELVEAASEPFTRARALNAAIRAARHDLILQADPDAVAPVEQVEAALRLAAEEDGLVVPYSRYLYLSREATRELHAGHADFADEDCEFSGDYGTGLLVAFSRRTWELAGGYDERFGMWGGDDAAFAYACDAFLTLRRVVHGPAFHSWHPRLRASIPGTAEYQEQFAILAEYRDAAAVGPERVRELVSALEATGA